jgi:16S rRNA (adenine1518-N6/adenine1519-N6)-dimethyltransferase
MPHSPLATPSATLAVLQRHGLATKKSLGQHFLVDDNIVGRILGLARVTAADVVLEIGPGIGTLTVPLCGAAGAVVAVERDRELLPALADTTADCRNLTVVRADALDVAAEDLRTSRGAPTALVANLPYQVAATVILRFFEIVPTLATATVMVQAEVGDRIAAEPGGKAYGAYTVKLRLLTEPAGRFPVPRTVFLPNPRVDSAVLRLERVPRPAPSGTLAAAARVATAAFAQRRKTLRNSLVGSGSFSPSEVDAALAATGIDGRRRAETLTVAEFILLGAEMHGHTR